MHGRTGWEWELVGLASGAVAAAGWTAGTRKDAIIEAKGRAAESGWAAVTMRAPVVGVRCNECGASARISADSLVGPECSECGSVDIEVLA